MRLSQGSAAKLGLIELKQLVEPTTCYIMLGGQCVNNCNFCSQNIGHKLSRIEWPEFEEKIAIEKINSSDFKRVCLQCTTIGIDQVKIISNKIIKPISVSYNFQISVSHWT